MLSLQHLLAVSIFLFFVPSTLGFYFSKCTPTELQTASLDCNPIVTDVISLIDRIVMQDTTPDLYENLTQLCEKVTTCYRPLACTELFLTKVNIMDACDHNVDLFPTNRKCLIGFMKTVHLAQSSRVVSCYSQYDFLEENLAKKYQAYTYGKSCFMNYAKDNCNQISIDYFSKKYQKLVDTIAVKPDYEKCDDEHHRLNSLKCKALTEETRSRGRNMSIFRALFGGDRWKDIKKVCKETQKCFDDYPCIFPESSRTLWAELCDGIHL